MPSAESECCFLSHSARTLTLIINITELYTFMALTSPAGAAQLGGGAESGVRRPGEAAWIRGAVSVGIRGLVYVIQLTLNSDHLSYSTHQNPATHVAVPRSLYFYFLSSPSPRLVIILNP